MSCQQQPGAQRLKFYVSGFTQECTADDLKEAISRICEIVTIKRSKNKGKKSKPHAIIVVETADPDKLLAESILVKQSKLTIQQFQDKELLQEVRHNQIKTRLFLNHLALSTTEKDIVETLGFCPEVPSISLSKKDDALTARLDFQFKEARDFCLIKGSILLKGIVVEFEKQRVFEKRLRGSSLDQLDILPVKLANQLGSVSSFEKDNSVVPAEKTSSLKYRIYQYSTRSTANSMLSPSNRTIGVTDFDWFGFQLLPKISIRSDLLKNSLGKAVEYKSQGYVLRV